MAVQLRDSDDSLHCDNIKNTAGTGAVTATHGIIMPAGKGIDFSASAGGGATSSLFDDYEEGTFTPQIKGATSGSFNGVGEYTKSGNVVTLRMNFSNFDATAWVGNISIINLPYPHKATNPTYYTFNASNMKIPNGIGTHMYFAGGASTINLYELVSGAAEIVITGGTTYFTSTTYLRETITYLTD